MEFLGQLILVLSVGALLSWLQYRRRIRRARKAAEGKKLNPWS
jgi:hypothetical protein